MAERREVGDRRRSPPRNNHNQKTVSMSHPVVCLPPYHHTHFIQKNRHILRDVCAIPVFRIPEFLNLSMIITNHLSLFPGLLLIHSVSRIFSPMVLSVDKSS